MNLPKLKLDPVKLRKAREKAMISQSQIANEAGITKQAVSLHENGGTLPEANTLLMYLVAYGVCSIKNLKKVSSEA